MDRPDDDRLDTLSTQLEVVLDTQIPPPRDAEPSTAGEAWPAGARGRVSASGCGGARSDGSGGRHRRRGRPRP